MKVIETRFNGILYRSRTEARWAMYLTELGHDFIYEHEGFKTDLGWYLPDFYLTKHNTYLEVKGTDFTELERNKCIELSKNDNFVVLLDGVPDKKSYEAYYLSEEICPVVFVSSDSKYSPFFFTYDFDESYFQHESDIIDEVKSFRFK